MHCRIDRYRDDETLRVLPEIPPLDQCLLEGENGIGKTLAIHLLELVAGQQPYMELADGLWQSLKATLGPTTLTLDDLAEGRRMRVELEPDRWLKDVAAPLGDWLGDFHLDGHRIPAEEAFALLSVVRIDGTETPDVTVRRSMKATANRVERVRLAAEDGLEAMRDALTGAHEVLHGLDSGATERADAAQVAAQARVADAETAAQHAREELAVLDEAVRAQAALVANETERPELEARLAALQPRLDDARATHERLEERAQQVRAALAAKGAVEKELAEADDTLQKRRRRLAARDDQVFAGLRDVALGEDDIEDEMGRLRAEADQLRLQRDDLDNGQRLERLVRDVAASIAVARADGVHDAQVVARVRETDITVGDLSAGLRARASELTDRPVPDTVAEIDRRLVELTQRRAAVERVSTALADRDRTQELVTEQEEVVARLREASGGPAGDELEQVVRELSDATAAVASVSREMVEVRGQLVDRTRLSAPDAERAIAAAQEHLGDGEALGDARHRVAEHAEREAASLASAREQLVDAQRDASVVRLSVEEAARRLRERSDLASLVGGDLTDADGQRRAVERLASVVATVNARIDQTRDAVGAIKQCADDLETGAIPTGLLGEPFMAAVGERLRSDLNGDAVRQALFDGRPVDKLDLTKRVVRWTDRTGVSHERPLAAFSTGEQAFAFTQARIRQLEPAEEPNRLVVLDEFGAFVSAERMRLLAAFLREPDVRIRAPQVVVILPLQVDYAREVKDTRGALRSRYEERVRQLADRRYFTADLAELT